MRSRLSDNLLRSTATRIVLGSGVQGARRWDGQFLCGRGEASPVRTSRKRRWRAQPRSLNAVATVSTEPNPGQCLIKLRHCHSGSLAINARILPDRVPSVAAKAKTMPEPRSTRSHGGRGRRAGGGKRDGRRAEHRAGRGRGSQEEGRLALLAQGPAETGRKGLMGECPKCGSQDLLPRPVRVSCHAVPTLGWPVRVEQHVRLQGMRPGCRGATCPHADQPRA